jgi:hypothetical protein
MRQRYISRVTSHTGAKRCDVIDVQPGDIKPQDTHHSSGISWEELDAKEMGSGGRICFAVCLGWLCVGGWEVRWMVVDELLV